ncbi:hypothetical protein Mp_7g03640 [Marchantia polymorpha subsp. ruderalis]|uniref:Uncharacterized protein n=2 Tax=Marchantia polymorpha TaxID=3197 RepID=A0AAF6BVU1_MARPO|nr:hypothetical protein MARPO_0074s0033 [Marchantia polymorpha]BBN16125.1 hypothetical protein Mp_7g03640 [Marchantia polymorpha subsp. ruderalis]|eukprot:PTQ35041.1 hypothetical protein MARPO_0074s0033 [Marchantia polymorpha]
MVGAKKMPSRARPSRIRLLNDPAVATSVQAPFIPAAAAAADFLIVIFTLGTQTHMSLGPKSPVMWPARYLLASHCLDIHSLLFDFTLCSTQCSRAFHCLDIHCLPTDFTSPSQASNCLHIHSSLFDSSPPFPSLSFCRYTLFNVRFYSLSPSFSLSRNTYTVYWWFLFRVPNPVIVWTHIVHWSILVSTFYY